MTICVVVRLSSLTVWWEFEVKNADVVEYMNRILVTSIQSPTINTNFLGKCGKHSILKKHKINILEFWRDLQE